MSRILNLTDREIEVLKLVANGYKQQDIAKQLNIKLGTVKTHINNITNKLNTKGLSNLTRYALEVGLA